jgi:hypothetical protein
MWGQCRALENAGDCWERLNQHFLYDLEDLKLTDVKLYIVLNYTETGDSCIHWANFHLI